jgi:hypothetical protein
MRSKSCVEALVPSVRRSRWAFETNARTLVRFGRVSVNSPHQAKRGSRAIAPDVRIEHNCAEGVLHDRKLWLALSALDAEMPHSWAVGPGCLIEVAPLARDYLAGN